MPNAEIMEFAKIVVKAIRDEAIRNCDAILHPDAGHAVARRWKQLEGKGHLYEIADVLIPDIVDHTVGNLLRAVDDGLLKLSFRASNGKIIDLPEEVIGELTSWYMGSWRGEYSGERYIDDFADLNLDFTDES